MLSLSSIGQLFHPPRREDVRQMIDVYDGEDSNGHPIYKRCPLYRPASGRREEPLDSEGSDVHCRPDERYNIDREKYRHERERLKTFEGSWRPEYNVTKEDLAKEGFIYKGPGDRVLCVFCLKSIRNWDAGDDVSGEHKRLYPICPWVRGHVQDNCPIFKTGNMKSVRYRDQPTTIDMTTTEARTKSFQDGAEEISGETVDRLVHAGFFYDTTHDIVKCFYCDMEMSRWKLYTDCATHHFPHCHMIAKAAKVDHDPSEPERNTPPAVDDNLNARPDDERGAERREDETNTTDIESDMQSPAVQAILESFSDEYSEDDVMKAVQALRISKSSSLTSEEILEKLNSFSD